MLLFLSGCRTVILQISGFYRRAYFYGIVHGSPVATGRTSPRPPCPGSKKGSISPKLCQWPGLRATHRSFHLVVETFKVGLQVPFPLLFRSLSFQKSGAPNIDPR